MYRKNQRISFIIFTVFCCAVISCGTPRPTSVAPCIKPTQVNLMIRWGNGSDTPSEMHWYEINAKGELFKGAISAAGDTTLDYLLPVHQQKYCSVASNLNIAFLKTQALHSPGKLYRFIEYSNRTSSVYLRAVWNPELQTFQSRDMRFQYDSLMLLIPE